MLFFSFFISVPSCLLFSQVRKASLALVSFCFCLVLSVSPEGVTVTVVFTASGKYQAVLRDIILVYVLTLQNDSNQDIFND